jgi:putative membrane protein
MKRIGFLSFALIATLTTGCSTNKGKDLGTANSTEPATVGTSGAPEIANRDAKDFVHYVAIANMAEIDLGKLAADRGTSDEVKKFAQMMIGDHTASGDKLKTLVSELKIEAPTQLDDTHQEQRDKLSKQQGADFDREYASAMVDSHKDLINQLEPRIDKKALEEWKVKMNGKTTAAGGTVAILPDKSDNPTTMRINQFAAEIYPTVHAHLEAAKTLETLLKKRYTTP